MARPTLPPPPDDESLMLRYAGFLVRRMWQIHVAIFLQETEGSDMTPIQFSILLVLRDDPDLEQVALASRVGLDRSNLSEVLARMIDADLVACSKSAHDRRAKIARLTARGLRLVNRLEARVQRSHDRLLEDLAPRERRAFLDMMKRVVSAKNALGRTRFSMAG